MADEPTILVERDDGRVDAYTAAEVAALAAELATLRRDAARLVAERDALAAVVAAARAIPAAIVAAILGWPPAGYDLCGTELALVEALVAGGYLMTAEEARR